MPRNIAAPRSTSRVPSSLFYKKTTPAGETLFVNIDLGLGKKMNRTAIFLPRSFRPDADLKLVLYLHGHKSSYPGGSALIDDYLDSNRFPFFGLREEVAASGQNVVFVAPTLGTFSEAGTLVHRGGFDAYLEKVLAALSEHFLLPRFGVRAGPITEIVLAAHSGGGRPLLQIVRGSDRSVAKIKECWCFDSMYGRVASAWSVWAQAHPNVRLYGYYDSTRGWLDRKTGVKRVLPRDNAEALACEVKKRGLRNVCLQMSRATEIGGVHPHFWVPKVHLRERLLNAPCVSTPLCRKR